MILPAIALGWNSAGSIARMTRSSLLEVMQADYIDTARAKGLRKQAVILGHALKNSMLPVITMMALQFSGMLSGAVITESILPFPASAALPPQQSRTVICRCCRGPCCLPPCWSLQAT